MSLDRRTLLGALAATPLAVGAAGLAAPTTAHAYNWGRTLHNGLSGNDVRELQIRVAGWAADRATRTFVAVDGSFGPATERAVLRFQRAYGLATDGRVGPASQRTLNSLEARDGSTRNFAFSEFHSKDGSGLNGGNVSSTVVRENVRRLMYKLEAVRKKAGDRSININSGFRSVRHNANVGGSRNSQHTYGITADFVISGRNVSQAIGYCQTSGFSGIIRYPSFTHADSRAEYNYNRSGYYWDI